LQPETLRVKRDYAWNDFGLAGFRCLMLAKTDLEEVNDVQNHFGNRQRVA
jgi:hypothetical protein